MRNASNSHSVKSVIADPPTSVGKITIKKGGDTFEEVSDGISFILDFSGITMPVPPFTAPVTFLNWQLTALGTANGYPNQDDYTITMSGEALGNNKVYFVGTIPFRSGGGTGDGIMYTVEVQVNGYATTAPINVDIEEI